MNVEVLDAVDITDKVLSIGKSRASIGTIEGILAESREYKVLDNEGELNFAGTGLFALNNWRNQNVSETDDNQALIFRGLIADLSTVRTDTEGFLTKIKGTSILTTVLSWPVESNDVETYSTYTVKNNVDTNADTIQLNGGTTEIILPAQITFSNSLIPKYNITSVDNAGGTTTKIRVDRNLEVPILADQECRISVPIIKTAAQELFDALVALNAVVDIDLISRIGSTFKALNDLDTANGRMLWVHIKKEDEILIKDHFANILEVADLGITVNEQGIIDIYRGNEYKGNTILDILTDNELLLSNEIKTDSSKIIIGYDCLYKADDLTASRALGDVDQSLIDEFKAIKRWQPIPTVSNSSNLFDYHVLYADAPTADYFGQRRIDYYGWPKRILSTPMRRNYFNKPLNRILPVLGKEFALSIAVADNQFLINEPSRVMGFEYDNNEMIYNNVRLELTNFPVPNLPVEGQPPIVPIVENIIGIAGGVQFKASLFTGSLYVEILYKDNVFILLKKITATELGEVVDFVSERMFQGLTYYIRFYSESFKLRSRATESYKFKVL